MNIVYRVNQKEAALSIPPEAVRGLKYLNGQWQLFASDPEAMAVAAFRISQETLTSAAEDIHRDVHPAKALVAEDGADVLEFLLAQKSIKADLLDTGGLPSLFPGFPGNGPRPTLGMKSPAMAR